MVEVCTYRHLHPAGEHHRFQNMGSKTVKQAADGKKQAGGMPTPVVALAARSGALPVYLNGLGSVVRLIR